VRPYLLARGVLLLLAFDLWYLMMPHAGRYGASGFNVAHFGWLDALPLPSDGLYAGVLILAGLAAFVGAATGERAAIGAAALLYTYGWAMSLLDGFQHHYLLSLLLLGFALSPAIRAEDLGRPVVAWAYRLIAVTLAIVYVFASASKFEARWQGGSALAALARGKPPFGALEGMASRAGVSSAAFWTLASAGVTAIELVVAAGYLTGTGPAARRGALSRRIAWAAFGCAAALHVEVELLGLQIGWFGAYMLLAACVFFLPEAWLSRVADAVTWPARRASAQAGEWVARPAAAIVAALAAAGAWVAAGAALDLPGAARAGVLAAAATGAFAAFALARGQAARGARCAIASAAAAAACWITIAATTVRFDFYRYLGGDLKRRGDLAGALAAYEKAEAYAPADRSRRKEIEELRQRIAPPRP
jgi:hypothetical protein